MGVLWEPRRDFDVLGCSLGHVPGGWVEAVVGFLILVGVCAVLLIWVCLMVAMLILVNCRVRGLKFRWYGRT